MKKLLLCCLLFSQSAFADLNLAIPSVPSTGGVDSIREGDTYCSNAIDSPIKLDIGVMSSSEGDAFSFGNQVESNVYARIIVPISAFGTKRPSRIDCSRLYEIQLEQKELELKELKLRLKRLENLEFEK